MGRRSRTHLTPHQGRFLDAIYDGLMNEAHRRPYHKLHYIDWALGAIDLQIRMFNKKIEHGPDGPVPLVTADEIEALRRKGPTSQ